MDRGSNRAACARRLRSPLRLATVDRYRSVKVIQDRSFRIEIELSYSVGDEGVLVSHGSLGGGYEITVEDGRLVWTHNHGGHVRRVEGDALANGTTRITAEVEAPGSGRWRVVLLADGVALVCAEDLPAFSGMVPLEGIDLGRSRRSPVSWNRHRGHGTWPYTGVLHHATYLPGALAPDVPEAIVRTRLVRQTVFD